MPATKFHPQFVSAEAAAEALGCSARHLRNQVQTGWFKYGVHFRDISSPDAQRRRYQYNVAEIAKILAIPPSQRKHYG